jgi:hypothetical protein
MFFSVISAISAVHRFLKIEEEHKMPHVTSWERTVKKSGEISSFPYLTEFITYITYT